MGSSTRETSSRTGGAHCWLAFGRFGQFLMLKQYALRFTLVSLLMRACLLEAEQERIGKKHAALKNSVLPASVLQNILTGLSKFKLGEHYNL